MTPRDYQAAAIDGIRRELEKVDTTLAVLPTGTGKTVVFSLLADGWQRGRVLVIASQGELIEQAQQKLFKVTGEMPDIEKAEKIANESAWGRQRFVVASKQTLIQKYGDRWGVRQPRYSRLSNIGLVVIDEAHESLTVKYKEIIDHYVKLGAKVLGVTATPNRADGKSLGQIYQSVAYQMSISDAIEGGWLVRPKTHCLQLKSLDLSSIDTPAKDFDERKLAAALEVDKVVFEIAELTAAESRGLKTVVYCASVAEARKVANILEIHHKYKAAWICGDADLCSPEKRERVLRSFANDPDGISIICNVGVLTTGWDCPGLEHIVMARPTKSLTLYTQIMGRGTRPLDGVVDFEGSTPETRREAIANSPKPFFKVTDLRDNSLSHKLISCVDVLAGEMGLDDDARQIAKRMVNESGEAVSLEDILAAAKARREEQERQERERLARRKAAATYERLEVDVFDGRKRSPVSKHGEVKRIKFGKYAGKPMSEVPTDYLQWVIVQSNLPWVCKGPCLAEFKRRKVSPQTSEASRVAERLRAILAEI